MTPMKCGPIKCSVVAHPSPNTRQLVEPVLEALP